MSRQHAEIIESVAKRYERSGYDLIREPRGKNLPPFLTDTPPDLIATKGEERLVVQVLHGPVEFERVNTKKLAEAVAREPGWHFQLVLEDLPDIEWQPPPTLPSLVTLEAGMRAVDRLAATDDRAAALLTLWSVFESAARHHLLQFGGDPRERIPSLKLTKQLLSLDVITDEDYRRLIPILRARNAAAHGFLAEQIDPVMIRELQTLVARLLSELRQVVSV